jgi:hypothetical protein
MTIANIGGGSQIGDGNLNEVVLAAVPAPVTAAGDATLTVAQLTNGIILGSPGTSAAAYTLPTCALLDAALNNAKVGSAFGFSVVNVNGSASGVITVTTAAGWTLVGLMTIAATAGTAHAFRARKTGDATWSLYRVS